MPFAHDGKGEDDELEVLPDGLLLKIRDVHLDHFLKLNPTAPVDLPQTRQPWSARKP